MRGITGGYLLAILAIFVLSFSMNADVFLIISHMDLVHFFLTWTVLIWRIIFYGDCDFGKLWDNLGIYTYPLNYYKSTS